MVRRSGGGTLAAGKRGSPELEGSASPNGRKGKDVEGAVSFGGARGEADRGAAGLIQRLSLKPTALLLHPISMSKLTGKVAVVTGASKGIGASIAEHLAAEGAAVVVNYSSSKSGADAVVKRITEKGGKAIAVQADVSKPQDITRLLTETKKVS